MKVETARRSCGVLFPCIKVCRTLMIPAGMAFLSYFLCLTKSRAKDLSLPQRSRYCGELNRGLENLESSKVSKGFNFVSGKPPLRRAESRFAEPRFSLWEGFNFVSVWSLFGCAESRFAEPRKFSKENELSLFASCKK